MTVIKAAGRKIGSFTTAPGDTIDLEGYAYAGFPVDKPLNFVGAGAKIESPPAGTANVVDVAPTAPMTSFKGDITIRLAGSVAWASNLLVRANDVTLDGLLLEESPRGHNLRATGDRLTARNIRMRRGAYQMQFDGNNRNSLLEDFDIADAAYLAFNDDTPGNDSGGGGIDFKKTVGPVVVRRGKITKARTEIPSHDYGTDGGAFSAYGGAQNVTVEDVELRDCLTIFEGGKGSTQPDNANFVFRRIKAYGTPDRLVENWWQRDQSKTFSGFLLRAVNNVLIEDCDFVDLDAWVFLFNASGNYFGTVKGVKAINNRIRLKAGDNRAYVIQAGIPYSELTLANNVQIAAGNKFVAYSETPGRNTSDLNAFRTWGVKATGETWGPVAPPPPTETPLQKAIRERDEALAALAKMTAERDTLYAANDVLTVQRDNAAKETARVKGIINRARLSEAATAAILAEA